jgi:hypothetical protein
MCAPLLLGLLPDGPAPQWDLTRTSRFLNGIATTVPQPPRSERSPAVPLERLLSDGLLRLLAEATPESQARWGLGPNGEKTDPAGVQYGVAGVLAVLTRAARLRGGDDTRTGVAALARWIDGRLFDHAQPLPGLYFGRSGAAWALYDAATFLGDETMATRAVELLTQIPVKGANADVTLGTAGAGLAHLHLWRKTGDALLRQRIIECADGILGAAHDHDGRLSWLPPEGGPAWNGFAHGLAGIGTFLLECAVATGRVDCLRAAQRAGETLHAAADVHEGAAWWPASAEPDPGAARLRLSHWCNGSSGIGTFLIRLWAATGDPRHRELAEAAATAVRLDTWYANNSTCHGLPGNGDFLLDLAQHTGDDRYRRWATEHAEAMYARHTIRDGLMLLPDESGKTVALSYGAGAAGTLGFLLRLHHGGPRMWMPNTHALPPTRVAGTQRQPAA